MLATLATYVLFAWLPAGTLATPFLSEAGASGTKSGTRLVLELGPC